MHRLKWSVPVAHSSRMQCEQILNNQAGRIPKHLSCLICLLWTRGSSVWNLTPSKQDGAWSRQTCPHGSANVFRHSLRALPDGAAASHVSTVGCHSTDEHLMTMTVSGSQRELAAHRKRKIDAGTQTWAYSMHFGMRETNVQMTD